MRSRSSSASPTPTSSGIAVRVTPSPSRWRWVCLRPCSHLGCERHPLLDAFTDGGLGVALLWPWSHERIFASWRPIEVSPIGAGFFSLRGIEVLWSELKWVVLPTLLLAVPLWKWRTRTRPTIDPAIDA
jgi:inner membrane protein